MWLLNGDFGLAFLSIWDNFEVSSFQALGIYFTMPRLIYLGVLILSYLATTMIWFNVSLPLMSGARYVWYTLHVSMLLLVVSLLFLPMASASLVVAMSLVVAVMLPLLFLQVTTIQGVLAYLLLVAATVVAVV